MASVDSRLTEPIPISEEDRKLFDAVELNNICIVQNFGKDTLQRLCRVRRSFVSEWSSSDEELQSAYRRACWMLVFKSISCFPVVIHPHTQPWSLLCRSKIMSQAMPAWYIYIWHMIFRMLQLYS